MSRKRKPFNEVVWAVVDRNGIYLPEICHSRSFARWTIREDRPLYEDAKWVVVRVSVRELSKKRRGKCVTAS